MLANEEVTLPQHTSRGLRTLQVSRYCFFDNGYLYSELEKKTDSLTLPLILIVSGHAIPSTDAWCPSLAWCYEDWPFHVHVEHEARRHRRLWHQGKKHGNALSLCIWNLLHTVEVPWPYNRSIRAFFFRFWNAAQSLTSWSHQTPRLKWMPRSLLATSLQERFHAMKICARPSDVIGMISTVNSLKAAKTKVEWQTVVSAVLDMSSWG